MFSGAFEMVSTLKPAASLLRSVFPYVRFKTDGDATPAPFREESMPNRYSKNEPRKVSESEERHFVLPHSAQGAL